ncbi:ribonuclease P protein component [Melghiribacillus thermohalophilus]|uniref:Ribonuclease P protein component n=1 Tax=Melghiribacillus thermohalophilus TaxID=1324956 RepID=A0A4R3N5X7_9BACI|nr:ribonuclease P protein component [Melghiribacillus thermohalophilus]TCT24628.1 ribonuclease P protein component [Melghiribacillus thermohalophilus]
MRKAYRIKKNEEFQEVFQKGKSFANRQLVLFYLPKHDQVHFRVGLSVGKKLGNAVVRNRIKRYLRQAFMEMEEELKQEYDFVVIARRAAVDQDYHQLKKSLAHVLKRTNMFKRKKYD